MLIEFSVGNYRSFKEKVTFSMVASNLTAKDKNLDENNVFAIDDDLKLLKSAAIYGANASGKSNLIQALGFMRWFIINSSKETQSTDTIKAEPFRLSTETEEDPSYFELVFLMSGKKYIYGFEVDQEKVVSEWLSYVPKSRETKLFERNSSGIKIKSSKSYNADGVAQRTRPNALFLSVSAQFNVGIAEEILKWISDKLNSISGANTRSCLMYTINQLLNDTDKNEILQFVTGLDLGIGGIQVSQKAFDIDSMPEAIPDELKTILAKSMAKSDGESTSVVTIHKKFRKDGSSDLIEEFNLQKHESEGTQKMFALSGPIINTLKKGRILFIDELDASLHPLISRAIITLFNSNETNPNNAQLVFTTHDTNLLNNKFFRRDQIWFTEKNKYGATDLYSLAEYQVRNDASFESDYIKGRYGAVPYVGNLSALVESHG